MTTATTTEKTYNFTCLDCGTEYTVTASEAAANGWTSWADPRHLGCAVTPRAGSDPFHWTGRELREMQAQAEGMENVSR